MDLIEDNKGLKLPLIAVGMIFGYFISQTLCVLAVMFTTGLKLEEISLATKFTAIAVNAAIWIGICLAVLPKLELPTFEKKGIKHHAIVYSIGVVILYTVMTLFGILMQLTDFKPSQQEVAKQVQQMSETSLFLIIIGPAILIPIVEELLFRGALYKSLKISQSPLAAAIISSILFGLAHLEPDTMPQLITIGFILAYVYEKSGSIIVPCLLHATNNFVSVMVLVYGEEIKAFLESLSQQ